MMQVNSRKKQVFVSVMEMATLTSIFLINRVSGCHNPLYIGICTLFEGCQGCHEGVTLKKGILPLTC